MVITGWKDIATTIGVSVSTAKTLRAAGLPVVNLTRRRVVAKREALAAWIDRPRPTTADVRVDSSGAQAVGIET